MTAYRIGSLFSGIGGLELGLERAGVGRVAWQCEIDPFARSVLAQHWPDVTRFEDIRELGRTIDVPAVDVLCGGFPCQDISLAGKGAGLEGDRSGLWFQYLRLVRDLRPRFVVLENVAAILVRGAGDVLGGLAALGYDAWWDCIPAAAVGAPHRRDRWFAVAWLADGHGERLEGRGTWRGEGGRTTPARPARPAHGGGLHPSAADVLRVVRASGPWSPESRLGRAADGPSARLDGRPLTRPTRPVEPWERDVPRTIDPKASPNRRPRLRALGNAVVPQVGEVVGRVLLDIDAAMRDEVSHD